MPRVTLCIFSICGVRGVLGYTPLILVRSDIICDPSASLTILQSSKTYHFHFSRLWAVQRRCRQVESLGYEGCEVTHY